MKQPKSRPKMSEVVEVLGNIINDTVSQYECTFQSDVVSGEEKEVNLSVEDTESETAKQGNNNYLKKVFDLREIVSLTNKSIGRLDWRNWAPGLVRS